MALATLELHQEGRKIADLRRLGFWPDKFFINIKIQETVLGSFSRGLSNKNENICKH